MDSVDSILAQWGQERPDLDIRAMGPLGRLGRLHGHLMRAMEKTFAAHGLNQAGFDVLATLRRSGPPFRLSPGALLGSMMITSGTLTHRLDLLEAAGLITRTANPEDGRGALVALTSAGCAKIDAAIADHVATQNRLLTALSANEIQELDRLLHTWLAGFE